MILSGTTETPVLSSEPTTVALFVHMTPIPAAAAHFLRSVPTQRLHDVYLQSATPVITRSVAPTRTTTRSDTGRALPANAIVAGSRDDDPSRGRIGTLEAAQRRSGAIASRARLRLRA